MRIAPEVASEPFLPKRTISAQGTISTIFSATSISSWWGRVKMTPSSSWLRTAAVTSGSLYPRLTEQRLLMKSTYSLPSTSQTWLPCPRWMK
ncbi:hypothetical protein D3C87_1630510 [compost metagenome]